MSLKIDTFEMKCLRHGDLLGLLQVSRTDEWAVSIDKSLLESVKEKKFKWFWYVMKQASILGK